jgi:hypothetical protein
MTSDTSHSGCLELAQAGCLLDLCKKSSLSRYKIDTSWLNVNDKHGKQQLARSQIIKSVVGHIRDAIVRQRSIGYEMPYNTSKPSTDRLMRRGTRPRGGTDVISLLSRTLLTWVRAGVYVGLKHREIDRNRKEQKETQTNRRTNRNGSLN